MLISHGLPAADLALTDLRTVLPHLQHVNVVRGGGLLFSDDLRPILAPEGMRGRRSVRPGLRSRTVGKRRVIEAESAEGIRALKDMLGVPHRGVTHE